MQNKRIVVDAILFNDEINLLYSRLKYYSGLVDVHVVMEHDRTFSGIRKELYAHQNMVSLEKSTTAEIVCLKFDSTNSTNEDYEKRWPIENRSRAQILDFLRINYGEARIVFSDVDEFPSRAQVEHISMLSDTDVYSIHTPTYYRKVNWKLVEERPWLGGKTFVGSWPPSYLTVRSPDVGIPLSGMGAHLSYLGMTHQETSRKFEAFSHSELEGFRFCEETISNLQSKYAVDHIGRVFSAGNGIFEIVKLDNLPEINRFMALENPELIANIEDRGFFNYIARFTASAFISYIRDGGLSKESVVDIASIQDISFPNLCKTYIYLGKGFFRKGLQKIIFETNKLSKFMKFTIKFLQI